MNLADIPFAQNEHGFWIVVSLVATITSVLLWLLNRDRPE
jgi:Mg2+ and Co2+ transporter CorA